MTRLISLISICIFTAAWLPIQRDGRGEIIYNGPHSIKWKINRAKFDHNYISFDKRSVQDVMFQVAIAYGKEYLYFIKPVDTANIGALGGGHIGTDAPLNELLKELTDGSTYRFSFVKDTIFVRSKPKPVSKKTK